MEALIFSDADLSILRSLQGEALLKTVFPSIALEAIRFALQSLIFITAFPASTP